MINGRDKVLFVQSYSSTEDALYIANQTESSRSLENELVDEMTKTGRVLAYGQNSESFDFTAYAEREDGGQNAVLTAIRNKEKLKVWEIDTVANGTGEYNALYAECLVESYEETAGEGFVEISGTLQVFGESVSSTITTLPTMPSQTNYPFEEPTSAV